MADSEDEDIREGSYVYWTQQDEDIPRDVLGEVYEECGDEKVKVEFPNWKGKLKISGLNACDVQKGSFVHLALASDDMPDDEAVGEVKKLQDNRLKVEIMGESQWVKPSKVLRCDFQPGTFVFWTKRDDDIPAGHLGEVVPGLNDEGRVKVKFPNGTWRFKPSQMVRAHAQRGSFVQWKKHDDDIEKGEVGEVIGSLNDEGRMKVRFKKGAWRFRPEELFSTEVQLYSLVKWERFDDDVPKGAVGQAVDYREGRIRVQFPNGKWRFKPNELRVQKIQPGHLVTWKKSDSDIPKGSIGEVVRAKFKGDKTRLRIQWPKGCWSIRPDDLNLLPFQKNDRVRWNRSDDDIPQGDIGTVMGIKYDDGDDGITGVRLYVKFSKGRWGFKPSQLTALNLDNEAVNLIKASFKKFDLNGDGKLSPEEVEQVLHGATGMSSDECTALFEGLDKDGNGKLDTDEFVEYLFGDEASGSQKHAMVEGFGLDDVIGLGDGEISDGCGEQDDDADDDDSGGGGGGNVITNPPAAFDVAFYKEDAEGIAGDTPVSREEWASAMLSVGVCRAAALESYEACVADIGNEGGDLTLEDLSDELNGLGGQAGVEELRAVVGRVKKGKVPTLDFNVPAAENPAEQPLAKQTGCDGLLWHLHVTGKSLQEAAAELPNAKLSSLEEEVLGGLSEEEIINALQEFQESPAVLSTAASLQRAREHCRKDVQAIIDRCRNGNEGKFTDETWNPLENENACLYVDREAPGYDCTADKPASWKRFSEVRENVSLVVSDVNENDIEQGSCGDCYLCGGLGAIVSNRRRFLRRAFCCYDIEVGVYGIIFFVESRFVYVIVDDYVAMRSSSSIKYAESADRHEIWVPMLEKAFFKHYTCVEMCDGGHTPEAVVSFLGGLYGYYDITDELFAKPSDMFDLLYKAQQRGEVLNTGFQVPSKGKYADMDADGEDGQCGEKALPFGLHSGHAYSVIRVVEACGHQLICLRNPWGRGEWKGPWSDKSDEWTDELREAFGATNKTDGSFWMAMEDFVQVSKGMKFNLTFGPSWQTVAQYGCFSKEPVQGRARRDYQASDDNELSLRKGEMITVLETQGYWSQGRRSNSDETGFFRTKDVELKHASVFRYDFSVDGMSENAPLMLALLMENQKRAREWKTRKEDGKHYKNTKYPHAYMFIYDGDGRRVYRQRCSRRHTWENLDVSKGPWSIYISCPDGNGKRFSVEAYAPHGTMSLKPVACTFKQFLDKTG